MINVYVHCSLQSVAEHCKAPALDWWISRQERNLLDGRWEEKSPRDPALVVHCIFCAFIFLGKISPCVFVFYLYLWIWAKKSLWSFHPVLVVWQCSKAVLKTFVKISSIGPWVLEDPESSAKDCCLVVIVIIMHQPCAGEQKWFWFCGRLNRNISPVKQNIKNLNISPRITKY